MLLGNKMFNELLLRNVLKAIKEKPELMLDIIDSYSDNQFKSKDKLLENIKPFISLDTEVAVLGCWYGSILMPLLAPKVKKIIAIDLNDIVVRIGKNILFKEYDNISWSSGDVFTKQLNYSNINLVINTSCEHMLPMKEWPYWNNGSYFAVTSNNMDTIEGHINCVYSIDEFKQQLPKNSIFLKEDEIIDGRGTRYLLVGKIS
jgi:hypothetical protein|tara:strand:+ start:422 stop:1030 length:609 start_codon:yes stop_codon:yes gene_type:complete